jgi:hypothetical protein
MAKGSCRALEKRTRSPQESLTGLIDYELGNVAFSVQEALASLSKLVRLASCAQLHALFRDTLCICKLYRQIRAKNKNPNFEVRVDSTMLNAL